MRRVVLVVLVLTGWSSLSAEEFQIRINYWPERAAEEYQQAFIEDLVRNLLSHEDVVLVEVNGVVSEGVADPALNWIQAEVVVRLIEDNLVFFAAVFGEVRPHLYTSPLTYSFENPLSIHRAMPYFLPRSLADWILRWRAPILGDISIARSL